MSSFLTKKLQQCNFFDKKTSVSEQAETLMQSGGGSLPEGDRQDVEIDGDKLKE